VTKALAPSPSPDAGPLRLAWLIDSLVTGGAEKLLVTFAEEAMRRPDVRLTVVALSDKPGPFRAELEALGVDLVVAPGARCCRRCVSCACSGCCARGASK